MMAFVNFSWANLLLSTTIVQFLFDSYLNLRQYLVLRHPKVPTIFEHEITQKDYDESRLYKQAKIQFRILADFWNLLVVFFLIQFEVLPFLWQHTSEFAFAWREDLDLGRSTLFSIAYYPISNALYAPIDAVEVFVVEQYFGFHNQNGLQFLKDRALTIFIHLVVIPPALFILLAVIQISGENFILYTASAAIGLTFVATIINPIFIYPLFFKITPLPEGKLKEMVTALTVKLNYPLKKISVFDASSRSTHSNAVMYGMPWQKVIGLFDSLFTQMNNDQILSVIAHELGHWKHGDTLKQFAFQSLHFLPLFGLFSMAVKDTSYYSSLGFDVTTTHLPVIPGLCLFSACLGPPNAFVQLIVNFFMRKFEFDADNFALNLGFKETFSQALIILNKENKGPIRTDWLYSLYHLSH